MPLHFRYQVPVWRNVLGAVFCVTGAVGMGFLASTNTRGLRLFHLVTLSPESASVLYWGLSAIFAIGSAMLIALTARSLKGHVNVALEETHVVAPRNSLKDELLSIPYSTIKQVQFHTIQKTQIITINSTVGQARVLSIGFSSLSDFSQFKESLASRLNG